MSPDIKVERLSDTCVRLSCLLEAPTERIYRAWTTPSEVVKWFVPDPAAKCEVSEMDLRVGGKYAMSVDLPGARHTMTGEYTALEPFRLIRFTWQGTCGAADEEISEVTVELNPLGNKTQLTLTHDKQANAASRDLHEAGWIGCLTGLTRYAAAAGKL
jgi:uncharacterized protein YndB with AHSA1/START domain